MNEEMQARYLASRQANSAKICAAPEDYKVCWVCLSIAFQHAPLCPICHAHRFYHSADAVRVVAGLTEKVAFPVTAGTVPRIPVVAREQFHQVEIENGN